MPTHFRELTAWNDAIDLATKIYKATAEFPKEEMYSLTSQIRRSSVSVPGNIAEGVSRYTKKDKIKFLIISRVSLEETRSHLSMAHRLNYLDDKTFKKIDSAYEILVKKLNSFIKNIQ